MRQAACVVVVGLVLGGSVPALGQNSCASCHIEQAGPASSREYDRVRPFSSATIAHFDDWTRSAHRRAGVGCDACHGGQVGTYETFEAHQGILNSGNPASQVHRANLPETCGRCHTGQYTAFQQSQHFQLLREGDRRGPTCSTCHGQVVATLLSPERLERQCAQCHGPDGVAPRPGRPEDVRLLLEGVSDARASLDAARRLLRDVRDESRRRDLEDAYEQAEVPLIQAIRAGHQFVFDGLRERLATARERVAALLERLVNPPQP